VTELLSTDDFEGFISSLWDEVPEEHPRTMHVRFDGFFADDEPDHDDAALFIGDRVRVSFANTRILKLPEGVRPFYYGTVRSIGNMPGRIGVGLDHLGGEGGGQWERDCISKVEAA
jgi:hypothetical protein